MNCCPHCEKELPSQECPHCNEYTPEDSIFCNKCGQRIKPLEISDDPDDWENRTLCSDGNCIGVVGSDGLCMECGKLYASEANNDPVEETETEESAEKENEEKTVD